MTETRRTRIPRPAAPALKPEPLAEQVGAAPCAHVRSTAAASSTARALPVAPRCSSLRYLPCRRTSLPLAAASNAKLRAQMASLGHWPSAPPPPH